MRLQSYKKARTAQYILPKKQPPSHINMYIINLYHPDGVVTGAHHRRHGFKTGGRRRCLESSGTRCPELLKTRNYHDKSPPF